MRIYVGITGAVFGLITILHIFRVAAEGTGVLHPFFVIMTAIAAAISVWSVVVFRKMSR